MDRTQQKPDGPLAAVAQLPRSMEPARDLWPEIAARLDAEARPASARRRGWGMGAVAAGIALAFLAGLLVGRQDGMTPPPAATAPVVTRMAAAEPSLVAAVTAAEREYHAALKGFEPVNLAPSLFQPQTRDELLRSWQAMKQAEAALTNAMDEHPDNPYLAQKLLDLRTQQLDFMRQLHMLDQNSRRNT